MTSALTSICSEIGVTVIPVTKQRGLMETCAVNTLERILAMRGPVNLRDTLQTFAETTNHKRDLVAPIIWAMSDTLAAHPNWFCGEEWFKAIDGIDLGLLHSESKANRKSVQPRRAIAAVLFDRLKDKFEIQEQTRLI